MISAAVIDYLKKGIFTILGLMLAVYLFIILMTYTGNDPSWSHISSDMTTINNMGGATGAWLSDLLYSFFGYSAWWLLVFMVYESILIWWNNKPTFWVLRLVAYIFLLLSASALFAQLMALIQQVADPVTSGLKGVAGGIIGLELQARLALLLTKWGSLLFLSAFVIVTATFAFNIHWLSLYHKLTDLHWFGSGIGSMASTGSSEKANALDNGVLATDDEAGVENQSSDSFTKAADYEQLPLELQEASSATAQNSSRFSHVLTDFLAKSGLGASVKEAIASAEAAATNKAMSDHLQPATATATANIERTHSLAHPRQQNTSATTAPLRKVEPSFAWNDDDMVADLLARESAAEQGTPAPAVPSATMNQAEQGGQIDQMTHLESEQAAIIESKGTTETAASYTQTNQANDIANNKVNAEPANTETHKETLESVAVLTTSAQVDGLADAWLAEHSTSEPSAVAQSPSTHQISAKQAEADTTQTASTEINNRETAASENTATESSSPANPITKPAVAAAVVTENAARKAASTATPVSESVPTDNASSLANMTPTNTPPSNPKEAPKAQKLDDELPVESAPVTKPAVSFAVPDGDASNHITDMMPEDNSPASSEDLDEPVMPDIHDDEAFANRSRSMQTAQYRSSLSKIPELSILDKPDPDREPSYTVAELEQLSELLEIKLQEFNVKAEVVQAIPGPVVTRFEVELAAGIKASKVTGISRDLARSLSMASLRVVEVIPGKPYIGIEVPNKQREMVRLIELLNTEKYKDPSAQISMAMGKDIGGKPIITDLARAPHMLVAGTTGSGKSVLVNSMLLSMLLKYTPNELRLILIDPKQLELANYNEIPHLLTPVVTDMTEAASSLSWCVAEMERRYQLMSLLKVRKLNEFNKKVLAAEKAGKPMLDPLWRPNDNVSIDQAPKLKTLPMIVIVADEFADMIMQVGKQAEELITRLAQKSRASGIHLMLATQRPSVDVITGLIKANIPVRAALRVNSKVDSRTILDSGGAEDMLGNGDMLFLGPGQIEPDRVHGAYVSDEEVNRVCDAWRERGAPDYIDNMAGNFELSSSGGGSSGASASGEDDDLYNDAVAFIMETRKVSASSIQRKFSIGYNRAARIVDSMEEAGLVSSMGKSGKRELLM
ncbi:DNA translocase FtsK 4TM domain-containing protein [Psychrobacter sp. 1U2]|uniref:DNA translocase FtsK n=1 Tax=Psychrobacter sp. 1U2 TaxID=3453577 RepID=UPI003F48A140